MRSLTSASIHRFSIIIFLLFLPNIFTAQVKIHEKIEISPKIKITNKANSSSSNSSIPYFEIVGIPGDYAQMTGIRVNIPSQCTITGSYNGEGTCSSLSMEGYALPNEAFNTSACEILSIGPVNGCGCGNFLI